MKLWFIPLSVVVFLSCTHKSNTPPTEPTLPPSRTEQKTESPTPKIPKAKKSKDVSSIETVNDFIDIFKQAVLDGDQITLMKLMAPKYKTEQHDKMLKGNTQQFLDELFCGNTEQNKFKCVKLKNIIKINLTTLKKEMTGHFLSGYSVEFDVSTKTLKIRCSWNIEVRKENGKFLFGLFGAQG